MKIKVRFPPSPTGNLHVGTTRTMIYNWLFAKQNKGEIVMRLEDTDTERSNKEFEADIMNSLKWLGLDWDGPVYRQSERTKLYRKYLEEFLVNKKAFWCNHSKEELEVENKNQIEAKEPPRHVCSHKQDNLETGVVIRVSVDSNSDRTISFNDRVKGKIEFKESLLGDFAIARNLDSALYHFAVVIDDIDMEISHIIRGDDHISNTPKHILIYEALDKPLPIFAHIPLVLGTDRSKLSKRHGATAVSAYKNDYLPEALFNFLGFLGYTFSKDIISKEEMVAEFELEKVHQSGAVFDIKKLDWINSQYIKKLPPEEFKKLANVPELPDEAVLIVTERLEKLSDIQNFNYLWEKPKYEKDVLQWKEMKPEEIQNSLLQSSFCAGVEIKKLGSKLDEIAKDNFGGDRGAVYWPLRVALSGKKKSPDPIEIIKILGPKETKERINEAKKKLES